MEITYSYWNGSGHRRSLKIEKGASVGLFLKAARIELAECFSEMRHCMSESLMFIKEDLILPHHITFYELMRDKVRGKSGPLFDFGVFDETLNQDNSEAMQQFCKPADIREERVESHAGKIIERQWYDKNKHVFPASRWEMYDPTKSYKTYSIAGNAEKYMDKLPN